MKILIVGINGFLGQELNKYFSDRGYDVFGTTHDSSKCNEKVFLLKIGDEVSSNILNNEFDVVIYLAHVYNTDKSDFLIKWYETILLKFKKYTNKQIYISSYSANKFATSSYGTTKYKIEQLFIQNNEYAISPGLIIGKGGIYNKINKFVNMSPLIVIPITKDKNLLPIIEIDVLCSIVFQISQNKVKQKNYTIYSEMVTLEDLIKKIISSQKRKKIVFNINANMLLNVMKLIEAIHIKLPVTSDSLEGFVGNQKYKISSDITNFKI